MKVDDRIIEALTKRAIGGEISCAEASDIARSTGFPMEAVGRALDVLELRIVRCQLGLFGYSPQKMIVTPAESVSPDLEKAIRDALRNERLPCESAWEIAQKFNIAKMDVTSACEALKIKIKPCQLGAF